VGRGDEMRKEKQTGCGKLGQRVNGIKKWVSNF
jgi:hypothetical protein